MSLVESLAGRIFDGLWERWRGHATQRRLGSLIVASFVLGLVAIELNREGWLPASLAAALPTNHFHAVDLAFNLLLCFETVALVFSLGASVASSLGKQFEVFSLILLRRSFAELSGLQEPVVWERVRASLGPMLGDALGALGVFVALGIFYRLQRHRPITGDAAEQASFVGAKKLIALGLLGAFAGIGAHHAWRGLLDSSSYPVFEAFYTLLIFSDILIVLLSLRTASSYGVVFRNSGFAAATVVLRLALTAPPYFNAGLGLLATLFAGALTASYNAFSPHERQTIPASPDAG